MAFFLDFGAWCFGCVIGWVLCFVLAHAKTITINSLGTIVSAVGGAALTAVFDPKGELFAAYSIGLASGFFAHVLLFDIDPTTGAIDYRKKK